MPQKSKDNNLAELGQESEKPKKFVESSYLDLLLKLPIGVVSLFYIIGIFVHGYFYESYGIYSLNLFKLNYILAGFWAFFYTILPALIALFLLASIIYTLLIFLTYLKHDVLPLSVRKYIPILKLKNIFTVKSAFLISLFLVIIIGSIFLYEPFNLTDDVPVSSVFIPGRGTLIIDEEEPIIFFKQNILLSLSVFASYIIFFSLLYFTLRYIKSALWKALIIIILTGMFSSVLLSNLREFSINTYKKIPSFVGGGKLRDITLILKIDKNAIPSLQRNYISRIENETEIKDKDNEIVFNLHANLVLESNEGYYIKTYENNVVFIPRDKILHIILQKPGAVVISPAR